MFQNFNTLFTEAVKYVTCTSIEKLAPPPMSVLCIILNCIMW